MIQMFPFWKVSCLNWVDCGCSLRSIHNRGVVLNWFNDCATDPSAAQDFDIGLTTLRQGKRRVQAKQFYVRHVHDGFDRLRPGL